MITASATWRNIEVDHEPAERVDVGLLHVGQREVRPRIPAMQLREPGANVAQADREVNRPTFMLRDRSPAAYTRHMLVAP